MTTIESNKLIAEFMGETLSKSGIGIVAPAGFDRLFEYHSDWNWLMPVLEKIESLGYVSTIEKLNFEFDSHRVYFNKQGSLEEVAIGSRDESKFVAIYMAVEDFIVWYNKNKN